MLYLFAKRQGIKTQLSYRFIVKNLPCKTVLDHLGWFRSNFQTRKDENSFDLIPCFFFINLSKLFLWGLKNIKFKKKAYKLLFDSGFLTKTILIKQHAKNLYK